MNSQQPLYRCTVRTPNIIIQPISLPQFPHLGGWYFRLSVIEQRGGSFMQIFSRKEILIAQLDELIIGHIRLIFLLFFRVIRKVTAIFIDPLIEPIQYSYSLLAVLQFLPNLACPHHDACSLVLEVGNRSGRSAFLQHWLRGGQSAVFFVELAARPCAFCRVGEMDVVGVEDVVQNGGGFSFYLESSVDWIVIGLLERGDEAFWFGVITLAEESRVGCVGVEAELKFCKVLLHGASAHNKSNRN